MCVLVRIDVAGISACQNSENGKLARSLVTQRRHFIERHYIVDRRPVLVLIDPFTGELWPKSSAFTIRYLLADMSHDPKSFSSLSKTVSALKYSSAISLAARLCLS